MTPKIKRQYFVIVLAALIAVVVVPICEQLGHGLVTFAGLFLLD